MHKETLKVSTIFHNLILQFKKSTLLILDAIRKIRNEIPKNLNLRKIIIKSYILCK